MQTIVLLDTVIGLIFIYAIYSVVTSALVEWIARATALRPRLLKESVAILLGHALAAEFDKHQMLKGLHTTRRFRESRYPDYIPSETFALIFMDLTLDFTQGAAGAPGRVDVKTNLSDQAEIQLANSLMQGTNNVGPVQTRVERWFANAMESASGRYKRRAQLYALVVAVGVVSLFNLDSIAILQSLYASAPLRANIVASATSAAKLDSLTIDNVRPLQLPIGRSTVKPKNPTPAASIGASLLSVAGYLMTIVALSFGAPFWFDLLKKLVNLRQTGVPPDEGRSVAVGR